MERDGYGAAAPCWGLDIYVLPGLELRLYDPASGQWLLTPHESEEARLAAEAAHLESEEGRLAAEAALQSSEAERQALEAENERLRELLRSLQSGQ